jgi:hypothetical protein
LIVFSCIENVKTYLKLVSSFLVDEQLEGSHRHPLRGEELALPALRKALEERPKLSTTHGKLLMTILLKIISVLREENCKL